MSESLIQRGLELFATGDVAGATRLWLAARAQLASHPQLAAYIEHVRAAMPDVVAALEAEAARMSSAEATASPSPAPRVESGPTASSADPWAQRGAHAAAVEVTSSAPGLSLVSTPAPAESVAPGEVARLATRLRELMSLDGFSPALEVATQLLRHDPQHAEARAAAARCRRQLEAMFASKLGDLRAVPRVQVRAGDVIWLDLDHRSGFVLAQVDGSSSFEEILEVSGMERLETMRILTELLAKGVIAVGAS